MLVFETYSNIAIAKPIIYSSAWHDWMHWLDKCLHARPMLDPLQTTSVVQVHAAHAQAPQLPHNALKDSSMSSC